MDKHDVATEAYIQKSFGFWPSILSISTKATVTIGDGRTFMNTIIPYKRECALNERHD